MYSAFLIHSLINGCVWPGEDEGGEDGAGCHSLLPSELGAGERVGETEQAAPLLPPPELRDLLDSLIKTFQHNTASYKEKNSVFFGTIWHS